MEPEDSQQRVIRSRRRALQVMSLAAGGAAAGAAASPLLKKFDRPTGPWRFFTADEAALVDLLCQQIIPTDDAPGAKEAGCVNYIDRQLAGVHQRFQGKYRQGLQSLQQTCQKLHGKDFAHLSWDEQTTLLKTIESNRGPKDLWKDPAQGEFFTLLRNHTMQGFFGSPRHGGNRDWVSFKMLDLEVPRVLGQNRYVAQATGGARPTDEKTK